MRESQRADIHFIATITLGSVQVKKMRLYVSSRTRFGSKSCLSPKLIGHRVRLLLLPLNCREGPTLKPAVGECARFSGQKAAAGPSPELPELSGPYCPAQAPAWSPRENCGKGHGSPLPKANEKERGEQEFILKIRVPLRGDQRFHPHNRIWFQSGHGAWPPWDLNGG